MEIRHHTFLTFELDADERSASRSRWLTPGEKHVCRREGWVGPRTIWARRTRHKSLLLLEINPWS